MAFKSDVNMVRTAWELSAGMLSFVVALGLGYWFGRTLDGWFGTVPWLTRTFVAFGFVAGVLNVYRTMARAMTRARPSDPGGPLSSVSGTSPSSPSSPSRTSSASDASRTSGTSGTP